MKKILAISLALVLVLSFSLVTATPVSAATLTVDTSVPVSATNFHTIQAAIDAATSGDTIMVAKGTYREYLHITTDNLTIIGAGMKKSIIDLDGLIPYWHYRGQHGGSPSRSYASRAGVLISGYGSPDQIIEDVTFKGFTVKNAGLNPPITATGTHDGSDDASTLTDSTATWTPGALVGQWVHNYGDRDTDYKPARSYGLITANTATTVNATLSGGMERDWDTDDPYLITPYEEFHNTYWVENPNYDGLRGIGIANGKNISILYCKVINSGYGGITAGYARCVNTHKYSEGIIIDHCIVSDHPSRGISLGSCAGPITITNNVCSNNRSPNLHLSDPSREYMGTGIYVAGKSSSLMASGLIANNKCKNNGFIGISLAKYTDGVTIENNTVTGHNSDQDGAGIFTYHWGKPEYCTNHIIRNNKVEKNIRGIVVYYSSHCLIEGNKIKTDSGSFPEGQGAIKLDYAHHIEVKDNKISCDGTGITVSHSGSYDNTFTGNKIKKAKFAGVFISHGAHDNTFMCNTIKGTKSLTRWSGQPYEETQGDGVFLWGYSGKEAGTGNVFHYNNIYDNDGEGMENQVTTATVNATCNWWGHYSGPGGVGSGSGDAVSNNVQYNPWLVVPAGSESEIEKAKIEFKKKDDKAEVKGQLGNPYNCIGGGLDISNWVRARIKSVGSGEIRENVYMEVKGKDGEKWEYKRPKGHTGPIKEMKIDWGKGTFEFKMDKVDLSGLTNPKVIIRVQNYPTLLFREVIDMTVTKDKWEYKAPHH